jgi:putative chitinase
MPGRNTSDKSTTRRTIKEPTTSGPLPEETKGGAFDFLKLGESYTSLILGIIVVVVATVLILSFVRNANMKNKQTANQQLVAVNTQQSTPTEETKNVPNNEQKKDSIATATPKPTEQPKKKIAQKTEIKKAPQPTQSPKQNKNNQQKSITGNTYTVAAGDSLWTISEKTYNSGYNWVDIAKANKLSNPGMIYKGMKLTLPKVSPKLATGKEIKPQPKKTINPAPAQTKTAVNTNKITTPIYTISKGDNLWTIAVRAYGDGYQWTKIAKANELTNPGIIHVGNTIKIPRK